MWRGQESQVRSAEAGGRGAACTLLVMAGVLAGALVPGAAADHQDDFLEVDVRVMATQCDAPDRFDERTNEGAQHEWIEVRNDAVYAVDLEGWTLEGEDARGDHVLPAWRLGAGESVRIVTGSDDDPATLNLDVHQGIWRNDPLERVWLNSTDGQSLSVVCDTSSTFGGGLDAHEDVTPTPVCVDGLTAMPQGAEAIALEWAPVEGAEVYHIKAVKEDGSVGDLIAVVGGDTTRFRDEGLAPNSTHRYTVAANWHPTAACAVAEATTISFFPGALPIAVAVVGGLGVLVLVRRFR